jgi:hypothetical protein
MKRSVWLVIALGLVPILATSAAARVAAIRTTAPLADPSESAVETAFSEAIEAALRGALAMGLPRVAVNRALILRDVVLVEILATDAPAGDEEDNVPAGSMFRRGADASPFADGASP